MQVENETKETELYTPGSKRIVRSVLTAVAAFLALFLVLAGLFSQSKTVSVRLDDILTLEVQRNDGQLERQDSELLLSPVRRGERMIAYLPLRGQDRITDAALCFSVSNATVRLYWGQKLLYIYDGPTGPGQIGNRYYTVPLPDGVWGATLRLECTATENNAFSGLSDVRVLHSTDMSTYLLDGHEAEFLLYITLLSGALAAFFFLLFRGIRVRAIRRQGLWIALFTIFISLWYLGSNRLLYVFCGNIPLCANVEYFALFAVPIPFNFYLGEMMDLPRAQHGFRLAGVFSLLLLVVVTVLNFTTEQLHYIAFLQLLHIWILLNMVFLLAELVRNHRSPSLRNKILTKGMSLSIALLILELLRFNAIKIFPSLSGNMGFSFATFGVLTLLATLLLSYIIQLNKYFDAIRERQNLMKMVYVDMMTGVANRLGCSRAFKELSDSKEPRYTVIFFDVNNLKMANDCYGHDTGDELLRAVAGCLRQAFEPAGFCGRWGGDEFIVTLTDSAADTAQTLLYSFQALLDNLNRRKILPFEVSVSYGMMESTPEQPVTVDDARREADRKMHEDKVHSRRPYRPDYPL